VDRCRAAQPSRGILVAMVLRIDPRYPLVWRSPSTLQIGASVARVVFAELNEVDERLIAALSVGVTKPGLTVIARSCGADDSAVPAILGTLAPVLAPVRQPRTPEVTVVGTGVTALRITEALGGAGVHVRTVQSGSPSATRPATWRSPSATTFSIRSCTACGCGATSPTCRWSTPTPGPRSASWSNRAAGRASTACSAAAPRPIRPGPPSPPSSGGRPARPRPRCSPARWPASWDARCWRVSVGGARHPLTSRLRSTCRPAR